MSQKKNQTVCCRQCAGEGIEECRFCAGTGMFKVRYRVNGWVVGFCCSSGTSLRSTKRLDD